MMIPGPSCPDHPAYDNTCTACGNHRFSTLVHEGVLAAAVSMCLSRGAAHYDHVIDFPCAWCVAAAAEPYRGLLQVLIEQAERDDHGT